MKLYTSALIQRLVVYGYQAEDLAELSVNELVKLLEREIGLSHEKELQVTRNGRLFYGEKYVKKAA